MGSLDFMPIDPTWLFVFTCFAVPALKAGSISGAIWHVAQSIANIAQ